MSNDAVTLFTQLALAAPILQAVEEIGYESPSPIQAESIPPLLEGRDLLGQAQTGTGKTAAFALPLLSRLDLSIAKPQILVLTPTRELAIQVAEAMQTYARHLKGFHILPVYGGQGMDVQLRQLRRGVHVVVGTPGRIQDHLRRGTLMLDELKALVLDEADEMLRMGFIDDVENILEHTPPERQVALFSATMPDVIKRVAQQHLNNPVEIKIKTKTSTVSTINQRYWQVTGTHKLDALTRILEVEEFEAMIIFVRTKVATLELAEKLEARGYSSAALNGDMTQVLREKTVERLKKGTLDIVVATDVAARGLDVERISHVFNYDIPNDTEAYVHRIGRTGRAGRKGEAILFVAPREKRMLFAIERATRQPITPMQLPSREDIAGRRVEQFKQQIADVLEAEELGYFEELIEGFQSEHNIGLSEIAAALAFMLQRERPLVPDMTAERPSVEERQARPAREGRRERPARDERPARTPAERPTRAAYETRSERPPRETRSDRPAREGLAIPARKESRPTRDRDAGMQTYRIEVGRDHDAQPKNIVGAIANEAGLDSSQIGHIKLHDAYSTVDLPESIPSETLVHLRNVWVCGRKLLISRIDEHGNPAQRKAHSELGLKKKTYTKKDKKDPKQRKGAKAKPAKKFAAKRTAHKADNNA